MTAEEPSALRLAATLLHPRFSMHADGHALDRESFLLRTQHLRQRLTKPPVFSWTKTAESAVVDGRAVVSSVHSVFMEFANGAANHTDYISMIEIDMTSGTLIHCDELSRLTSITAPTIGDCCSRIDHPNGERATITYSPIGGVYGIQPWNFPCYQAIRYSIANLMAACVQDEEARALVCAG